MNWQRKYEGKEGAPKIFYGGCCHYNLWMWYPTIGWISSLKNIHILETSPFHEQSLSVFYNRINLIFLSTMIFFKDLFVVDGIYPNVSFCEDIYHKKLLVKIKFRSWLETSGKDIKFAFDVIKRKFGCLTTLCKFWFLDIFCFVVKDFIIMNKMMV